jgi:hypothetical protein
MPFFEAGTEVFLRDWQETVLRVVVRDSVLREKDPILGIVNFPLKDVFTEFFRGYWALQFARRHWIRVSHHSILSLSLTSL